MTKYYCQNCGKEINRLERIIIKIVDPNLGSLSEHHTIRKAQVGKKCCLKIIDKYMKKMDKKISFSEV